MATLKKMETHTKMIYEWKLENFGLLQESKTRLAEQTFEMLVEGPTEIQSKWFVGLKPADTLQVYFQLLEKSGKKSKIWTKISISCQKEAGVECFLKKVENSTARNEEFIIDLGWGMGQPASDWNLSHLTDEHGTLTLTFEMKLYALQLTKKSSPQSLLPELNVQKLKTAALKRVHGNYSKLLEDSLSHDVKIVCSDGVEIGAHKMILSAQNTFFASMLGTSDLSDNRTAVVSVEGVPGKIMKIILHYIYTGELLPECGQADTIVEFIYAAGICQLTEILEMLDHILGIGEDDSGDLACNPLLLSHLATKLSLKVAEKKLLERIVNLTIAAKNNKDILAIFGSGC